MPACRLLLRLMPPRSPQHPSRFVRSEPMGARPRRPAGWQRQTTPYWSPAAVRQVALRAAPAPRRPVPPARRTDRHRPGDRHQAEVVGREQPGKDDCPDDDGDPQGYPKGGGPEPGAQRQEQAEQRQRLKPLRDKVKAVERELESKRSRLIEVEAQLVDESIYSDPNRKDELTQLIREQAAVKSSIEELEGEWLDASEALEQAT